MHFVMLCIGDTPSIGFIFYLFNNSVLLFSVFCLAFVQNYKKIKRKTHICYSYTKPICYLILQNIRNKMSTYTSYISAINTWKSILQKPLQIAFDVPIGGLTLELAIGRYGSILGVAIIRKQPIAQRRSFFSIFYSTNTNNIVYMNLPWKHH